MKNIILLLSICFLSSSCKNSSTEKTSDNYRKEIENIIKGKNAHIGVSISGIEDEDTLTINNAYQFPLLSVFKFHIALAILQQIDSGKLSLDQPIVLSENNLHSNTWSPLREKYPSGNSTVPLREVLFYTVSQSDNNGCDILLQLLGGPQVVNNYIHQLGISGCSIVANEAAMHQDWDVQYQNWSKPYAATDVLKLFYSGKILSPQSFDALWKWMTETGSGVDRIQGKLPKDAIVAHKTGTSDTNSEGVTAAVNDIGIVTLPEGKHFAIAVFITDSKENNATNEKIIADIARAAWNHFTYKR